MRIKDTWKMKMCHHKGKKNISGIGKDVHTLKEALTH